MSRIIALLLAGVSLALAGVVYDSLDAQARAEEQAGNLTRAQALYESARRVATADREPIAARNTDFALARVAATRRDFRLSRAELLAELSRRVADFKPAELADWEARGLLDTLLIDGERRYFVDAVGNAAFRDPAVRARVRNRTYAGLDDRSLAAAFLPFATGSRAGRSALSAYSTPVQYLARWLVRVRCTGIAAGKTIRLWLPFPALRPEQPAAVVAAVDPAGAAVLPPDRTAPNSACYAELRAAGQPVAELAVTGLCTVQRTDCSIDPARAGALVAEHDPARRFLASQPDIVVDDDLRTVANGITSGEANPYLAARKIYRWIVRNLSFSTLPPSRFLTGGLSRYVYERRAGDGAGQAALFAALCRAAGVPARVVGGYLMPLSMPHGWAECYVPNYGWVPADPGLCVLVRDAVGPDEALRLAVEEFYFGHLDNLRLAFTSEADYPELAPAKHSARSSGFNFTVPEAEWEGGALGPEDVEFRLTLEPVGGL